MQNNNKRIAKNTLMLYFRMFIMMAISLYTSRVVLETLGVSDYGIYSIVGSVVSMSMFITSSMGNAVQRYITYAIGVNDQKGISRIFSMCCNVQIIVAIILLIILETLGLWLLDNKLNIPWDRIDAANWVYQFSILTFVVNIVSVPYNAAIIAHEKMDVFAYISILEAFLKLGLVLLLKAITYDKLISYGGLILVCAIIVRAIFQIYCHYKIKYCQHRFIWDGKLFLSIFSFSGWNMLGSGASTLGEQGVSIILNLFFSVVVNAAKGVSMQVKSALFQFHNNILMAFRPQIIKLYAQNELKQMTSLIYKGAKYSFFLLYLVSLPVLLKTEFILNLWLTDVPEYAIIFTQLMLIISLIDSLSGTIQIASQATGKLKQYNIWNSIVLLLQLPLSYILLRYGLVPESVFYVNIGISCVMVFTRVYFVHRLIPSITIRAFFSRVLNPSLAVASVGLVGPFCANRYLPHTLLSFFIVGVISVFSVLVFSYFIGTDNSEKELIKNTTLKIILLK